MPYLVGYSTASLTTLAALATTDMVTGYSLQVQDQDAWYHYNSGSSASADGLNVVSPSSGVGRWFRGNRISGIIWSDTATPGSTVNSSLVTAHTSTIPAGTLQSGDFIEIFGIFSGIANAGTKAHNLSIGATTIAQRTGTTSPFNTIGRLLACGTNQIFLINNSTTSDLVGNGTELTIAHTFASQALDIHFRISGAASSDSYLRAGFVRVMRS